MKKIHFFISILCILFSLNVWSQDALKLPQEIAKLDRRELRFKLMINSYLITAIESQQAVNQAIGMTHDSKYIVLPYSVGLLFLAFHVERFSWVIEDSLTRLPGYLNAMERQWFTEYDKLISQTIREGKMIFKLRREAGLKNKYYRSSALPFGREIIGDIQGKKVDLVYKERIGEGFKGGKYQALLDGVEKNLNISDRDAKIRILKSLAQREENFINLKRQLSHHIGTHPEFGKYNFLRKFTRGYGLMALTGGVFLIGSALGGHVLILIDEHTNLSHMKETYQAEVDYILYLLAQYE